MAKQEVITFEGLFFPLMSLNPDSYRDAVTMAMPAFFASSEKKIASPKATTSYFTIPKIKFMKSIFQLSFLALALLISTAALGQKTDKDLAKIESILMKQQMAWNNGNIPEFMKFYKKADDLLFSGASGITLGWQATLDRYKKSYPDKGTMGKLAFEVKHLEKLSKKTAMMIGSWNLERAADMPGGHFMLIWKKRRGKWRIVADHTSSRCEK